MSVVYVQTGTVKTLVAVTPAGQSVYVSSGGAAGANKKEIVEFGAEDEDRLIVIDFTGGRRAKFGNRLNIAVEVMGISENDLPVNQGAANVQPNDLANPTYYNVYVQAGTSGVITIS
jgi:hypothetical protein